MTQDVTGLVERLESDHYDYGRMLAERREAASALTAQAERIAELERQLPEGMKHCTIEFKECSLGHGWLTAKNWAQHDCPYCDLAAAREDAGRYQWLRDQLWHQSLTKHVTLPIVWSVDYPGEGGKSLDAAIDAARSK